MEKDISIRFTILSIITLLLFGGGILYFFITRDNNKSVVSNAVAETVWRSDQPTIGNVNAPVTIVEFADYKCPACKQWGEVILPKLKTDYIDTNKVKLQYVNVMFHGKESTLASIAAETVFQDSPKIYWEFHKALYKNQEKKFTKESIIEISDNIKGVNSSKVKTNLNSKNKHPEVERDYEIGKDHDIKETPTIFVNNLQVNDSFDYAALKKIIEKELLKDE